MQVDRQVSDQAQKSDGARTEAKHAADYAPIDVHGLETLVGAHERSLNSPIRRRSSTELIGISSFVRASGTSEHNEPGLLRRKVLDHATIWLAGWPNDGCRRLLRNGEFVAGR